MKQLKPIFWQNRFSIISIFLLPISLLIIFLTGLRKIFITSKKFNIPTICVGNIYVGGTGKTPLSILIYNEFKKINKRPVIIKKFYSEHQDEYLLIKNKTNSLITNKKRSLALNEAIKKGFDIAILDDGFQDYTIKKSINVLCFNEKQFIGNGFVIPSGPLRERFQSIKNAQIIIINGNKNLFLEQKIFDISKNLKIYYAKYLPTNIENFKNKKLYAFAGIGNPNNFFDLMVDYDLDIKRKVAFPDHYNFTKKDLEKIINEAEKDDLEIVTTEKDYMRLKKYDLKKINFIKIKVEIDQKDKMFKQILDYL